MMTLKDALYILSLLAAGLFWLFTLNGLPPRVDRLEEKVASHDRILTEYGVKIDIVLDDVKTIKSLLLNRQGDK